MYVASAARGQAGEEVGERGLGQKTQEAGPEQRGTPAPPLPERRGEAQTGGTEHAGGGGGAREQQAFTQPGGDSVRCQPLGLLLSELSLFPLLGLNTCSSFCQDHPPFSFWLL